MGLYEGFSYRTDIFGPVDCEIKSLKTHFFTLTSLICQATIFNHVQCREKVFAPFLFFLFFAYLSHLKDSDHQTNFNITQR